MGGGTTDRADATAALPGLREADQEWTASPGESFVQGVVVDPAELKLRVKPTWRRCQPKSRVGHFSGMRLMLPWR